MKLLKLFLKLSKKLVGRFLAITLSPHYRKGTWKYKTRPSWLLSGLSHLWVWLHVCWHNRLLLVMKVVLCVYQKWMDIMFHYNCLFLGMHFVCFWILISDQGFESLIVIPDLKWKINLLDWLLRVLKLLKQETTLRLDKAKLMVKKKLFTIF